MTLDDLNKRRASLQGERQQLHEQLAKISANISAFNGAIQECEYWIEKFKEPPPEIVEAAPSSIESNDTDTGDIVSFS